MTYMPGDSQTSSLGEKRRQTLGTRLETHTSKDSQPKQFKPLVIHTPGESHPLGFTSLDSGGGE